MSIIVDAMNMAKEITTELNDFAMMAIFKSPHGDEAQCPVIFSDHTNTYDENGVPINGKQSQLAVSELPLIEQDYPTRNHNGHIDMLGHIITIQYPDGTERTYKSDDIRPDYTINLITIFLSEYK